ncbi:very short patch repair endonuclease [Halomonas urumqiensis]|uniref:Very short patch repair endonuclease n=1 Tax=Halomonas urumqiensis TaxID=1684789 RepID=A0A2N7UDQ5_9GAMM|nr:DNA mismatch endonuclease Vsr [Halomonas urumqiensis]PMR78515.1 very short patch repair endonuclease [Halomonas urumqiensis]PTB03660.1 very short patch repair endonuclease [Halomonas urumqiensis]
MSRIRGQDTNPEMAVRRYLHACGFRFRLHRKDLPGKPDLVLTKHRLVIFVHGCFWHRHEGCFYATSPATRKDFWRRKLIGNVERDRRQQAELIEAGWRVLVIWECGLKHQLSEIDAIGTLTKNTDTFGEWPATPPRVRSTKGK